MVRSDTIFILVGAGHHPLPLLKQRLVAGRPFYATTELGTTIGVQALPDPHRKKAFVSVKIAGVRHREDDPAFDLGPPNVYRVALLSIQDRGAQRPQVFLQPAWVAVTRDQHAREGWLAPEIGDDAPDLAHVLEERVVEPHPPRLHEPVYLILDQFLVGHLSFSFAHCLRTSRMIGSANFAYAFLNIGFFSKTSSTSIIFLVSSAWRSMKSSTSSII
jgi:hypothetical protein